MIEIPLILRYSPQRLRETAAWLIPGDTATWLDELLGWGVDLRRAVLRPLPGAGLASHAAGGALVTLAPGPPPKVSPRCQEYGRIAERLFLPVCARLEPELLESEAAALLEPQCQYVFHPTLGLVRITKTAVCRAADLLAIPTLLTTDWDRAEPGRPPAARLVSVEPEQMPSVDDVLNAGKDDIGSRDLGLKRQREPSSEGGESDAEESGGLLSGLLRRLREFFSGSPRETTPGAPPPPGSQQNEIDRLLRMLEQNPDEGLRYALPLGEQAAHRGLTPPGGRLVPRTVDFNFQNFAGGEAGSPWYVSSDRFAKLQQHYRALANREIGLGRYRRAAYIYAHLLNDLSAAAQALASGGHWREAAVLYRDRLKNPVAAADCLEKGGLWAEAIEAYGELKAFEKLGEIHNRLGQVDEARAAYRQEVQKRRKAQDHAGAARVLEQNLDAADEALAELDAGWPGSSQAVLCLEESFRLLERRRRPDEIARRIEALVEQRLSEDAALGAVRVLAELARSGGDAANQALATDAARVKAGLTLATASDSGAGVLLNRLADLAPRDRLLGRDCKRFCARRFRRRDRRSPTGNIGLNLVWKYNLPAGIQWMTALAAGEVCYAAGYGESALVVARWPWRRGMQGLEVVRWNASAVGGVERSDSAGIGPELASWRISPGTAGAPILLCRAPSGDPQLLVHAVGARPLPGLIRFSQTDAATEETAGPHRGFTQATRGAAFSPDGLLWLVEHKPAEFMQELEIQIATGGRTLGSHAVPLAAAGESAEVPIASGRTHVYLAAGNAVLAIKRGVGAEQFDVPSPVRRVLLPIGTGAQCAVLACENHVLAYWNDAVESRLEEISDSANEPLCAFSDDGRLVVVERRHFEIYRPGLGHFERIAAGHLTLDEPIALFATGGDLVMACDRHGEVQLLRL